MKKVKIMLTAITVLAVVGGALAFKAAKFNSALYCTDTAGIGACLLKVEGFSTQKLHDTDPGAVYTCTTTNVNPNSQDCSPRMTYINE